MNVILAKECLTNSDILKKQRSRLNERNWQFLYYAWRVASHLESEFGARCYDQYVVALCQEGQGTVAFIDTPVLDMRPHFKITRRGMQAKPVKMQRILEEDHCCQGLHISAVPDNPGQAAYDVVIWVVSALRHLEIFFGQPKEKVPGKVALMMLKSGAVERKYQYNATCSLAMIVGMAIDTHEKLAMDSCNRCGKKRASVETGKLFQCQSCRSVRYCGRTCQVDDWKSGHAKECDTYASWQANGIKIRGNYITIDSDKGKEEARAAMIEEVIHRIKRVDPDRVGRMTILC